MSKHNDLKNPQKVGQGQPWVCIDIGSTYTRAYIWDPIDDCITPVRSETGDAFIPTKVAYELPDDVIVG